MVKPTASIKANLASVTVRGKENGGIPGNAFHDVDLRIDVVSGKRPFRVQIDEVEGMRVSSGRKVHDLRTVAARGETITETLRIAVERAAIAEFTMALVRQAARLAKDEATAALESTPGCTTDKEEN